MIQGSFCSKLNALSYDILYIVFLCLLYIFLVDVQNFTGNLDLFRKNGQKEFPIPLAGRPDQVLPLYRAIFCCLLL